MKIKMATITAILMTTLSSTALAVNADTQYNGHSYKVFNDGMTWDAAKRYCESQGGHLVTINSSQEQAVVMNLLRSKGNKNSYWLGGYKNGNSWSWVTGESFSYTNWGQWQPDGDGNALMMYYSTGNGWPSGTWNDLVPSGGTGSFFGTNNFGFICEWDSAGPVKHDPQGNFDTYGTAINNSNPNECLIRVIGWALDEDDLRHKVRVHVYIGGTAGNSSVPQFEIVADKNHDQHNGHGFDATVSVPLNYKGKSFKGFQKVTLYALNDVGSGTFKEIGFKNAFMQFKGTAAQEVPAYTNKELTQRNGNERVDAGDEVTVLDESGNAYYVRYPVRNGTKERWVNKNDIFKENPLKITLNVPVLKQSDPRWSEQKINTDSVTIGQKGCTITSLAMKYNYQHNTNATPIDIRNVLQKNGGLSGNNVVYGSVQRIFSYNYKIVDNKPALNNEWMKEIYNQLKAGRPVIIGAYRTNDWQHWVIIKGYIGNSTTNFNAADFQINDPQNDFNNLQQFINRYGLGLRGIIY